MSLLYVYLERRNDIYIIVHIVKKLVAFDFSLLREYDTKFQIIPCLTIRK